LQSKAHTDIGSSSVPSTSVPSCANPGVHAVAKNAARPPAHSGAKGQKGGRKGGKQTIVSAAEEPEPQDRGEQVDISVLFGEDGSFFDSPISLKALQLLSCSKLHTVDSKGKGLRLLQRT
jgi:hypothetical protein